VKLKAALITLYVFLGTGLPAKAGLDPTSHVFVILMENHNWADIKGSASAPYINNTLLPIAIVQIPIVSAIHAVGALIGHAFPSRSPIIA